jgi:hypothetical protein
MPADLSYQLLWHTQAKHGGNSGPSHGVRTGNIAKAVRPATIKWKTNEGKKLEVEADSLREKERIINSWSRWFYLLVTPYSHRKYLQYRNPYLL